VHYSYLATTHTYWALAFFSHTRGEIQDPSQRTLFSRPAGGSWTYVRGMHPQFPCPGDVDPPLMALWKLTNLGGCAVVPGPATESNGDTVIRTGTDVPDGQYFGHVRTYQLNLDGSGQLTMNSAAGVPGGQQWDQHPQDVVSLAWAPGVAALYSVGTSKENSHVVTGTFDAAYAKRVTDDFTAFDVDAYGFIVTVKLGLITALQEVGPNTPTDGMPAFAELI
jgi:hypothetical protein